MADACFHVLEIKWSFPGSKPLFFWVHCSSCWCGWQSLFFGLLSSWLSLRFCIGGICVRHGSNLVNMLCLELFSFLQGNTLHGWHMLWCLLLSLLLGNLLGCWIDLFIRIRWLLFVIIYFRLWPGITRWISCSRWFFLSWRLSNYWRLYQFFLFSSFTLLELFILVLIIGILTLWSWLCNNFLILQICLFLVLWCYNSCSWLIMFLLNLDAIIFFSIFIGLLVGLSILSI